MRSATSQTVMVALIAAAALMGCGKKKKDEAPSQSAPAPLVQASEVGDDGRVTFSYGNPNDPSGNYLCRVDTDVQGSWQPCQSQFTYQMSKGDEIAFHVKNGETGEIATKIVNYAGATVAPIAANQTPTALPFGDEYGRIALAGNNFFRTPQGMFLTSYSTDRTINNNLEIYQVLSNESPGRRLTFCEAKAGGNIIDAALNATLTDATGFYASYPGAPGHQYCFASPKFEFAKHWQDQTLGFNHVEATNENNAQAQSFQLIRTTVYRNNYDNDTTRDFFRQKCGDPASGVEPGSRGKDWLPIKTDFWGLFPQQVEVHFCQVDQTVRGRARPMRVLGFKSRQFPLAQQAGQPINSFRGPTQLSGGPYLADDTFETVEYVIMTDRNVTPSGFVRDSANLIMQTLGVSKPTL